ncbi:hypothetical protein DEI83_09760 [Curtobacterium sp. MCBD17_021]|nr:hypothetical protein DEI83_09760 [Curtobacterium sp. MCBD17_021]
MNSAVAPAVTSWVEIEVPGSAETIMPSSSLRSAPAARTSGSSTSAEHARQSIRSAAVKTRVAEPDAT